MNHKRGKPKAARSGCLLCKPHKVHGNSACSHNRQQKRAAARGKDEEQG